MDGFNMVFNEWWSPGAGPVEIVPDQIHVWRIGLDLRNSQWDLFRAALPPDEQARAGRFRFERDRQRYIAGRGMLRHVLARFLHRDPQQIRFDYRGNGKPVLADDLATISGLSFNLAHAHGVVVCAVTLNRPMGVDVEYMRRKLDMDSIAKRFFAPNEYAALLSSPDEQRRALFFRFWTCKEAYIKATGKGLSQLEVVEIVCTAADTMQLKGASHWSLYEFSPSAEYAAAVAVEGQGHALFCWNYKSAYA